MSRKRIPLVFPADFLMVFSGLFGAVFCFVTGFAIQVDVPVLSVGILGISLFFTAVFSLKKGLWRAVCLLTMGGGFGFAVAWMWEEVSLGVVGLTHQVWTVFASGFPFLYGPEALEIPETLLLPAVTALLLLLSALVGCYLAWGLVRLRVFWPGALITMLFLVPPLAVTITPGWLPLTILLAYYGMGLLSRLVAREDRRGRARLTCTVLPLTLALLTVLHAALPEEGYRRSPWIEEQRIGLTDWATRLGQSLISGDLNGLPNLLVSQPDAQVDLAGAGPLRFTGRTALRVKSPYSGHIYLRGYSAGVYTGTGWEPLEDDVYGAYLPELEGGTEEGDWETVAGCQPQNFPALADQTSFPGREAVRMEVEIVSADPGYVYVPYHLETPPDRMSGAVFRQDSYLARGAGIWNYVLYVREQASPLDGSMLTGPAVWAEERYRALVNDVYTALPEDYGTEDLAADLIQWLEQQLAENGTDAYDRYHNPENSGRDVILTGGAGEFYSIVSSQRWNRQALVRMVADYLADRCVYDPDTPYTPAGEDFVDYFLQESGRGYCMHFASAATVLLRALGVPARYVVGYVADVKAGKTVDVPDFNAHAWVEVYYDGYGWQPEEVTPSFGGTFPWSQPEAEATPSPSPTPTPAATPRPSAGPQPTPTPAPQGGQETQTKPLDLRWLWLPAGVLALLAAAWLRRRLAVRGREKGFRDADVNASVIRAYRYLERVLRWSGAAMDPELLDLAGKAKFSQHTLTEEERERFLAGVAAAVRQTEEGLGRMRKLAFRYIQGL